MRATAIAFGALALAGAMPAPLDLAAGFFVLVGLLAWDRTSWSRHLAVFAWMCSRVWPNLIHDPYAAGDLFVMGAGGALFGVKRATDVRLKRAVEVAYAVLVLLPYHGTPHPVVSAAFSVACVCAWRFDPDALLGDSVWILCLKSPAAACAPTLVCAWRAFPRRSAPAKAAAVAVTTPTPPSTTTSSRPANLSARVPPEYYHRSSYVPPNPALKKEASAELSKWGTPIESDVV